MTGPEFRSRFQLGERLTEPPVVTHRATDGLGNFVLAHFLLGSPDVTQASLVQKLQEHRDASPWIRDRIREVSETDGVTVVVTDVLEGFSTFPEWLEKADGEVPGSAQPDEEGEDVLAGAQREEEEPEAPTDPGSEEMGQEDPSGFAPKAADLEEEPRAPGAYTQLFRASDLGSGSPETPEEPAPAGEEERKTEKKSPGSYTMLFGAGPADSGGPEPPGTEPEQGEKQPRDEPQPPEESQPPEEPQPASPASPAPPDAFPEPRFPGVEAEPPQPPAPSDASPPTPADAPPPPPAEPPQPPPATGEEKKSPGAYTRIFRALGSEERPESPPPPPRDPPPARPPAPEPPPSPASPPREASPPEWQRWKDTPGASGGHIPSDDYLSRLGGAGGGSSPPSSDSPPVDRKSPPRATPEPVFPEGGGRSGPGHYTMVREGLSPSSTPPPGKGRPGAAGEAGDKTPGREADSMPSRRSRMLTIIGLVAIFLVIAVLILVFALTG